MGSSDTPETVSDPVRMTTQRISIFPLTGAIIFKYAAAAAYF